jgi:hypothetical protein
MHIPAAQPLWCRSIAAAAARSSRCCILLLLGFVLMLAFLLACW